MHYSYWTHTSNILQKTTSPDMVCNKEWKYASETCTVLIKRVRYFVLLNYSCKSWSNFKTRDRFGICRSWGFQNTPYMSNLTKFWLRYLRLKTHDTILLFSCYLICWRWKWQKSEQFVPKTVLFTIKGTNINKNNP